MPKERVVESYQDADKKFRWRAGFQHRFKLDIKLSGSEPHDTIEEAEQEAKDWLGDKWKFTRIE